MDERTVFARSAKLYSGTQDKAEWVANVTEVSASGKGGEFEGTMTVDQVNATFEKKFIDFLNSKEEKVEVPEYFLDCILEDPLGTPASPERFVFRDVKFWSIPIGFSTTDVVTRDIDFTGHEDKGNQRDYTFRFVSPTPDSDTGVSNS